MTKQTDFGYQKVDWNEKQRHVNAVFSSVASRYDVMNDFMSVGVHRLWKKSFLSLVNLTQGQVVCDLAGGTGDIAKGLAKQVGQSGAVYLTDINAEMLQVGRMRLDNFGCVGNVNFVQANAELLPYPDNHFDALTIAFGLRNVRDKAAALAEMRRVVKPGGRVLILEFSTPYIPVLGKVYDWYSFSVIPKLGKHVAKDEDSYRYLAESIRKHPDQDTLKAMMYEAGFDAARYINYSGGIVAVHIGEVF